MAIQQKTLAQQQWLHMHMTSLTRVFEADFILRFFLQIPVLHTAASSPGVKLLHQTKTSLGSCSPSCWYISKGSLLKGIIQHFKEFLE